MLLSETVRSQLISAQTQLLADGKLPSKPRLATYYDTFRAHFGPDQLRQLDGESLLELMHSHGNRDSLVYWLEFKNDEELPAVFGSIAGGSAFKFGLYRSRETSTWITGQPRTRQEITVDEAILIARKHRDQLLLAVDLLAKLPVNASDDEYAQLQRDIDRAAPDVGNSAWGHKYLHFMFPDKLDDYHVPAYQRFHLIKVLQVPPMGDGRYVMAGRFIGLAAELGWPINHLTTTLTFRNGEPHRYWRIGTRDGTSQESHWDAMRQGNYVSVGWKELGDLSWLSTATDAKAQLRALYEERRPSIANVISRKSQEIINFVTGMQESDLVLASDGKRTLGIGRVVGPYSYNSADDFPNRRPVEWLDLSEFQLPETEGLLTTVCELRKYPTNLVEIERRILEPRPMPQTPPDETIAPPAPRHQSAPVPRLNGIAGRVQSVLERKGQVILYGPPGTGKTYWALQTAQDLAAYHRFGAPFLQLTPEQKATINGDGQNGLVRMCSFHPAYGYEDFLEGYRPVTFNAQLSFQKNNGVFKRLCDDARDQPHRYFLVIDEINRGDIPRIFGELLTVLEKDKRTRPIMLPLSGEPFAIPANIYIIGTMNTADRSIALLDTALRRRFGFVELMPDSSVLDKAVVSGIPLGPWLDALNHRIVEHVGRDARNLQIGHAYLLESGRPVADFHRLARVIQDDIIPLLQEYCYEDYSALAKILGEGLVDETNQRVRHELFDAAQAANLVQALLAPSPEITTAAQVVASDTEALPDEDEGVPSEDSDAA